MVNSNKSKTTLAIDREAKRADQRRLGIIAMQQNHI
jgi:hypothetical protein